MTKVKATVVVSVEAREERYITASPATRLRIRRERAELVKLAAWRKALEVDRLCSGSAMQSWYLYYNTLPKGIPV